MVAMYVRCRVTDYRARRQRKGNIIPARRPRSAAQGARELNEHCSQNQMGAQLLLLGTYKNSKR